MWRNLIIAALLVMVTVLVYKPVKDFGFLQYDDRDDVWGNKHINTGLTWENFKWALTADERANWFPLTRLSNQLDYTFFPKDMPKHEGRHHLTNVWLHAANTVLLFLVLAWLTRARWSSAVVAALFALHPLHVESVAWITERKDVLSTLFWLLTTGAYALYATRRDPGRYVFYGLAVLCMALGLASKPMLVTLPFVLLLLDYWPLGRLGWPATKEEEYLVIDDERQVRRTTWLIVLLEKLPLLALSAVSCWFTYVVQQKGGAMSLAEKLTFLQRLANVPVAYVGYLAKMVWPSGLAVFYPYEADRPLWMVLGAAAAVAAVTALAVWQIRRRPYLAVGWFWYLGTLVPVIGLVQVGEQSMADRYTYVPLIGVFIMIVWGAADVTSRWPLRWMVLGPVAAAAVFACGLLTTYQLPYWKNTHTLFDHEIAAVGPNSVAYYNKGDEEILAGHFAEAAAFYRQALKADPSLSGVHNNLGWCLVQMAQAAAAQAQTLQGPQAENLRSQSRQLEDEAIEHYHQSIKRDPKNASAYNNLGLAFYGRDQLDDAAREYQTAVGLQTDFPGPHNNLGLVLMRQGRLGEAAAEFRTCVDLDPSMAVARKNLGQVYIMMGKYGEGLAEFAALLRQEPGWPEVMARVARVHATCPDAAFRNGPQAVRLAHAAIAGTPTPNFLFLDTLACAYAETGRFDLAAQTMRESIEVARAANQTDVLPTLLAHLATLESGRPVRDEPPRPQAPPPLTAPAPGLSLP
jgi:protein O-mannosyl-transferase